MSNSALDLCARRNCFGCGLSGSWLCRGCARQLSPAGARAPIPGVAAIHCPWAYEGAARDLILALKLRSRRDVAEPLIEATLGAIRATGSMATCVTWVPARRRDIRARGFDHARVLAAGIAEGLGLPLRSLLVRTDTRPDQAGLTGEQRRANLVGAFEARPEPGSVLLVDDLITTGATATVCTHALGVAGAGRVEVATPCRA